MAMKKKPPRRRRLRVRLKPLTEAEIKKKIRYMLRPRYSVECYYRGLDRKMERELVRLARRPTESSGMFLPTGLRDVGFEFASEAKALVVARRIKEHLPEIRVMLRSFKSVE